MTEKFQPSNIGSNSIEKDLKLREAMETFYKFLRIEDKSQRSDTIFILGGSSLLPVKKAAELYNSGFSDHISFISIGGKFGGEKIWGKPEDEMYYEKLQELNVPEDSIVRSGLTTNTLDEAKEAIPFLESHGIYPARIILVSRPIHQRRAFATFKQQHPEVEFLNCPADEPLDSNDLETRQRLVQEAERLLDYSKKGDIETPDIPRDVLKAAALIRMELKDKGQYEGRKKPTKQ